MCLHIAGEREGEEEKYNQRILSRTMEDGRLHCGRFSNGKRKKKEFFTLLSALIYSIFMK
jgi:hypothetical protein